MDRASKPLFLSATVFAVIGVLLLQTEVRSQQYGCNPNIVVPCPCVQTSPGEVCFNTTNPAKLVWCSSGTPPPCAVVKNVNCPGGISFIGYGNCETGWIHTMDRCLSTPTGSC